MSSILTPSILFLPCQHPQLRDASRPPLPARALTLTTMSTLSVPSTPRSRTFHAAQAPVTPQGAPNTSRTARSGLVQASPHYQTTRRHSLYGTEDRIVIDPGSRVWKVGFSGEGHPRDVFFVAPLWGLQRSPDPIQREEEDRVLAARLQAHLRAVFHE